MLKLGNRNIASMHLGGRAISKAYLGSNLVWSAATPLPYDAEVEYLESTGTQWIDTGIYGRDGLLAKCRFRLSDTNSRNYIFQSRYDNASFFSLAHTLTSGISVAANTATVMPINVLDMDWHSAEVDTTSYAKKVVYDDLEVSTWSLENLNVSVNHIYLFSNHSATTFSRASISYFSIRDTSTDQLLLDLIPVRKDGVGYMYDRVSGQLLGNSGTGDFIIGPDKPYDYEVAWVERDYSVPWLVNGSEPSRAGYSMPEYVIADDVKNLTRKVSAIFSADADPGNTAVFGVWGNYSYGRCYVGTSYSEEGTHTVQNCGTYGEYFAGNAIQGISVFNSVSIVPSGNGSAEVSLNGVVLGTLTATRQSTITNCYALFKNGRVGTIGTGRVRLKNARLGSDVYLIPVVKGNAVGFYNMVDGKLFLAEQECLSAGPRV